MFRFERRPKPQRFGPFSRVERWKSSLDLWFEDGDYLQNALLKVGQKISAARAYRGNIIRKYLSQA
jgi:hypothetical protein